MNCTGYISEIFGSFQGEGPFVGERHIFVRLAGCSLGCNYCDTTYSMTESGHARLEEADGGLLYLENPLPVRTVIEAVSSHEIFSGFNSKLAITGGEPLEQPEFLRALLEGLDGRFKVLLETNGVLPGALLRVKELVDIISMDFKLPSATGKGEFWDAHREFVEAARGKELIAKAVVSRQTPKEEVEMAANILAKAAPDAIFVIQPMTPSPSPIPPRGEGSGIYPSPTGGREGWGNEDYAPSPEKLIQIYLLAKRILRNVRVIPQVHKILGVK